ncbi:MAG: hypothetical protein PHT63_01955, partial [Bacteroidales bacterium]|nr:hypothetical protein [Bacteroidales bacterium]
MKRLLNGLIILLFFLPELLLAQRLDKESFSLIPESLSIYFRDKANIKGKIAIDSVIVRNREILIHFNQVLSEYPLRPYSVSASYALSYLNLPIIYRDKELKLYSNKKLLEELVPPLYLGAEDKDHLK